MQIGEYWKTRLASRTLSDKEQIKTQFDQIAEYMLSYCIISIDECEYHLADIEFYYHSKNYPNPYVHKNSTQLKTGLWYFYNLGQDLTFGSNGSYGGILVRGLKTRNEGKYIDGPTKIFDEPAVCG